MTMQNNYEFKIVNPNLDNLGYVVAIANLDDKHDRSAPSHFHWKILKSRMIIFSNSSILACPDKSELKQVHLLFNKVGDGYDKLTSLFLKFSLVQDGAIRKPTSEVLQMCFHYTMTAKIAPVWNTLGCDYLINNRDFLTANGPQEGVKYRISCNDVTTTLELKPVKINIIRTDEDFLPGEWIRVLPRFAETYREEKLKVSLNKASIDDCCDCLPQTGSFKSYKDLRRHWKNIHGYRLPEEEGSYCTVQFWRGEPLTYPKICLIRNLPIITPMPKSEEKLVLSRFLNCLESKMSHFLAIPLHIQQSDVASGVQAVINERFSETQAVSLCTPTQYQNSTY